VLNSRAHTGAPSSALLAFRGWQYTTTNTHTLTHRTSEREREREREKTAGSYNFLGWRKAKFEIKGKTHQLHFGCCWGEQHRKLGGGWSLLLIIWYMNTLILHWGGRGPGRWWAWTSFAPTSCQWDRRGFSCQSHHCHRRNVQATNPTSIAKKIQSRKPRSRGEEGGVQPKKITFLTYKKEKPGWVVTESSKITMNSVKPNWIFL